MKKFENVDFYRGKGPIQSHLPWKVGALHIFFIILLDPADEYLCSGEVRKNLK